MSGITQKKITNLDLFLSCGAETNLADRATDLVLQKKIAVEDVPAVFYEVLINNWNYSVHSINLKATLEDADVVSNTISKWKAMDIVLLYHHPDLGPIAINPKNPTHKEYISDLRKNELVVIYTGYAGKKDADALCVSALDKCADLLNGKKVKAPDSFSKGSFNFKKPKPVSEVKAKKTVKTVEKKQPVAAKSQEKTVQKSSGSFSFGSSSVSDAVARPTAAVASPTTLRKMTPMVSVPVTNELFHNGNVEAWKRIIASYTNKYPKLQIFVYYDGERITDINALFKWGKVKHGSCIQFVVAGDDIQDVAKLKRYFTQGASPMFEAFLQGAPGAILRLF